MRHYKKLNISFAGFLNRELIAEEFTRPTQIQIGPRVQPHIDGNITFQKDPARPWAINCFMAQVNFRSSDEHKVMRIMNKYGGKVVQLREELHQRGHEETDNTSKGKEYNFECVDELISHRSFN
ncbi:MAG: hypothetical protein OES34_09555 [Nitrosopumilus sp.]|nr:hypothetical protein [Nitrosopumilus sp.]